MKKIYAIMDCRDNNDKAWVTDPIILENDVQASMAFANYQRQLIKEHVKIDDLRIYRIGYFDNDNDTEPLIKEYPLKEIPTNLVEGEEDNE